MTAGRSDIWQSMLALMVLKALEVNFEYHVFRRDERR